MSAVILVADDSPDAAVLARWLGTRVPGATLIQALSPDEVPRIAASAAHAGRTRRIVALTRAPVDGADIQGHTALRVVSEWLHGLGPFERRSRGVPILTENLDARAAGSAELERLARRLGASGAVVRKQRRAGRPPGQNPFRGVGLDVCVVMLLHPERTWTERALAAECRRSAFGVHRVLGELDRRGLVERARGATALRAPEALRDELLRSWPRAPRLGISFAATRAGDQIDAIFEAGAERDVELRLAGPSAAGLVGGALVLYVDGDERAFMRRAGFVEAAGPADVTVWSAPDAAVFRWPAARGGRPATNRVVTFLDLAVSGESRHTAAAHELWSRA